MRSYIIVRSRGAIALGAIFTLGTAAVLFSDARHWSDLSTDHLISGLVLLGTIASGHMFWQQVRGFRLLPAAGLALLFLAGTAYCVTTSAARNVEKLGSQAAGDPEPERSAAEAGNGHL